MTIQVEEKSLQLALVKAAGKLGITQDALEYEVVSKVNGFLGIFGRKVLIKAWKKGQRPAGSQSARPKRNQDAAVSNLPVLSKEQKEKIGKQVQEFCEGICTQMTGEKVNVERKWVEDRLHLNIKDDFLAAQISKNARIAEALEHLLRKLPDFLKEDSYFRVFVDANGIRQARETELIGMARDLSNKVFENKRPIVLNYRSSYDRKIIHMALDKDDRVYTKSIGSGPNRKLMILPSKDEHLRHMSGQEA